MAATPPPPKTILLLATTEDKASKNMVQSLLARGGWAEAEPIDTASRVWRRETGPSHVYLWEIQQGFLRADGLDTKWLAAHPGQEIQELIFLSRHAAVSGRPSLTIHPIGNPGQPRAANDEARAAHGGIPGRCVPPSPRMAPLLRQLHQGVKDAGLTETFEVTLEATHHGPWCEHPSMFVEIGSKEEDWGREDAAAVWVEVLEKNLGLCGGGSSGKEEEPASAAPPLVAVAFGGGHYTAKTNDLVRHRPDVFLGHILATYCFNGAPEDWQHGVDEAIKATKAAYEHEEARVIVYIDKKSFKSAPRQALVEYLEAQGIPYAMKESEIQ